MPESASKPVPTVDQMETMPKFLKDAIPENSTRREADSIKVALIRKFGLAQFQACIGRSANKNSWGIQQ
jgi:hypothetical protein